MKLWECISTSWSLMARHPDTHKVSLQFCYKTGLWTLTFWRDFGWQTVHQHLFHIPSCLWTVIFQQLLISRFQDLLLRHVNHPAWRQAKEDLSNILPHGEHAIQFVLWNVWQNISILLRQGEPGLLDFVGVCQVTPVLSVRVKSDHILAWKHSLRNRLPTCEERDGLDENTLRWKWRDFVLLSQNDFFIIGEWLSPIIR